tara:strand:- start:1407 stop:1733 length:327 start_codon:yes stop_codon:yes gene_type:complete
MEFPFSDLRMARAEMRLLDMRGSIKKTGNISGLGYAMATLALVALTIIMQTLTAPTGIHMRKLVKHGGTTVLILLGRFQSIHLLLGSPSMDIQSMDSWVGMRREMYRK